MKYLILGFIILNIPKIAAQQATVKDYTIYHKKINQAERLFFMKNKADSALAIYDDVFNSYNFIFVKDLVNAAQIAHYSNKPYKKYLKKGFEFGLKFAHLKNYPLFKDEWKGLEKDQKMQQAYAKNREKYLQKIDFDYLNRMYNLFIQDQLDKRKDNYRKIIRVTLRNLRDIIDRKGFPGDKIIGISDSTIFAEIGKPQLDLKYRAKKYGEKLWYVETRDKILSASQGFVLLVHYACPYGKLKSLLWEEMEKGNLHPRDIGMLYDNIYRYTDNLATMPDYCDWPDYTYFRLNLFATSDYPELSKETISETNALRKSFFIVPLAVDKEKEEFEEKYGFVLFSGFWECR